MEHIPVLLEETIASLNLKPSGCYIDCTLGLGGHTAEILEKTKPNGQVLGIEGDPKTLALVSAKLESYGDRAKICQGNFKDVAKIAGKENFLPDGILYDLGLSSYLLAKGAGFSFQTDSPLDMRMRPWETSQTAAEIVNGWPEKDLANLFYEYGGERNSRRIAKAVVEARRKGRIISTVKLAEIISSASGGRKTGRIHPATKTFQALRIVVNQEFDNLSQSLKAAIDLLAPHGRLVVIAYHEGEDRIVKTIFKQSGLKIITKKPIVPKRDEIMANPRARSAKMRVLEK